MTGLNRNLYMMVIKFQLDRKGSSPLNLSEIILHQMDEFEKFLLIYCVIVPLGCVAGTRFAGPTSCASCL